LQRAFDSFESVAEYRLACRLGFVRPDTAFSKSSISDRHFGEGLAIENQYQKAISIIHSSEKNSGSYPQPCAGVFMKRLFLALICLLLTSLADAAVKSIVLVHGAFVDGSGWKAVADILEHDGYSVRVVQEPLTSLAADVTATRVVLDQVGPSVLVGHSWGGMIITEAGDHASVRSLVYVAAFQPDVGETAGALQGKTPPAAQSVVPIGGGFVQVEPGSFHRDVAPDVPERAVHFASISQVPIAADAFGAAATHATWSTKPSFAVVATQDRMINPELERFMSRRAKSETIELTGSHAIFLSHPREVANLIEKAARAAQ
jgi:pimeloyl-ACP methyl ester carboxylesterase